ncbi:MAG: hypothetical protein ACPGVU_16080 [Limisphaerales bacterium]
MHFPKFWALGSCPTGKFRCWRWSDSSQADAQSAADEAATELAAKAAADKFPRGGYGYPDRPMREEIIRDVAPGTVISRNGVGCLILKTEKVMFVDIDIIGLEEAPAQLSFFGRLFGNKTRQETIGPVVENVRTIANSDSSWGWRIYATRAGLRLIATHAPFSATAEVTKQTFEKLDADPLYRRLCEAQESFRARLTPKPWRCNHGPAPVRWPFPSDLEKSRFDRWEKDYLKFAAEFATCSYLGSEGNETIHPEIKPIVDLHDELTLANSELELA